MTDIKINQIRLRKNLATKWGVEGYLYSGNIEDLYSYNVGDQNLGNIGQPLIVDDNGKPTWEKTITIVADHDSWVTLFLPDTNYGSSPYLHIWYIPPIEDKYFRVPYLHFPISEIPIGKTIISAVFWFFVYSFDTGGGTNYVYKNAANFDEDTITYNNRPAKTGHSLGNISFASGEPARMESLDLTDLVKGWYSGSISNYGIQIEPISAYVSQTGGLYAKECADPSLRPRLLINYY